MEIFISKSFRTIVFIIFVFFLNVSAAASSGIPQVSLVYLGIEMIQPGKSFLKFDFPGWIISMTAKTLTDKNHQASSQKFRQLI